MPQLEKSTKPSRRHSQGKARCQQSAMRDGNLWQCSKPARDGFTRCGKHGAGYATRERRGLRKNKKLAAITSGEHVHPATMQTLFDQHPHLRDLFEAEKKSEALLDLRPQFAMAKVLANHYVEEAALDDTNTTGGRTPPAIAAIGALSKVAALAERVLKIEGHLGTITRTDLRRYHYAIARAFNRFIPPEDQEACKEFIRVQLVGAVQDAEG